MARGFIKDALTHVGPQWCAFSDSSDYLLFDSNCLIIVNGATDNHVTDSIALWGECAVNRGLTVHAKGNTSDFTHHRFDASDSWAAVRSEFSPDAGSIYLYLIEVCFSEQHKNACVGGWMASLSSTSIRHNPPDRTAGSSVWCWGI